MGSLLGGVPIMQGPEGPEQMQIHILGPKNPLKASANKSKQQRHHQVCPSTLVFAARARAHVRALRVQKLLLGQLSVTASSTASRVSSEVEEQQFHERAAVLGSSAAPLGESSHINAQL